MKWTRIAVTDDNSWVVIGISAVSGDVASQEYVENVISGCKDERVSSLAMVLFDLFLRKHLPSPPSNFPPASSKQAVDNKQFGASGTYRTSRSQCGIVCPLTDMCTITVPFPKAVAGVGPIPVIVELLSG